MSSALPPWQTSTLPAAVSTGGWRRSSRRERSTPPAGGRGPHLLLNRLRRWAHPPGVPRAGAGERNPQRRRAHGAGSVAGGARVAPRIGARHRRRAPDGGGRGGARWPRIWRACPGRSPPIRACGCARCERGWPQPPRRARSPTWCAGWASTPSTHLDRVVLARVAPGRSRHRPTFFVHLDASGKRLSHSATRKR